MWNSLINSYFKLFWSSSCNTSVFINSIGYYSFPRRIRSFVVTFLFIWSWKLLWTLCIVSAAIHCCSVNQVSFVSRIFFCTSFLPWLYWFRSPFLYCPYSFIRFIIFTIVQAFLGFVISDIVVHRLFYNTFKCFVFLLCPRVLQQFRVD